MPRPSPESFHPVDDLLSDIDQAAAEQSDTSSVDALMADIDVGFDERQREIVGWPDERKRKEAADSSDEFVLNVLSLDPNFNVRILTAVNACIPEVALRKIAETGNDYQRMVAANNPSASSELLDRIADLSGKQEVVAAVLKHPNLSQVTKFKLENRDQ